MNARLVKLFLLYIDVKAEIATHDGSKRLNELEKRMKKLAKEIDEKTLWRPD